MKRGGVRHSVKLVARVGGVCSAAFKLVLNLLSLFLIPLGKLHQFVLYAYAHITPPCFYSPGNEFHVSVNDELAAITYSLRHKQQKIIHQHQEKQHRYKLLLISFALLLLAFRHIHHEAHSATNSSNIGVSTTVTPKCKINSTSMAFGTYDPQLNTSLDVNGAVVLSCTKNTATTITMSSGANTAQAQGTTRAMKRNFGGTGNSDFLSYELYRNAARTSTWSITNPVSVTATSAAQVSIPIYGRIPRNQNITDGGYTDTIVVTVNF